MRWAHTRSHSLLDATASSWWAWSSIKTGCSRKPAAPLKFTNKHISCLFHLNTNQSVKTTSCGFMGVVSRTIGAVTSWSLHWLPGNLKVTTGLLTWRTHHQKLLCFLPCRVSVQWCCCILRTLLLPAWYQQPSPVWPRPPHCWPANERPLR